MRRFSLVSLVAVLTCLVAGGAFAQSDNRGLYDRIDRLERDLQTLQGQAARGGGLSITSPEGGGGAGVSPVMAGRLDERVDQLEDMVRQLTGKVEETNFKISQINKNLELLKNDTDLRFKDLAAKPAANTPPPNRGGGNAVLTPPPAAGGGAAAGTPPANPQAQYEAAYAAAQASDYDTAERGFREFLDKNPTHKQAANAQYWLGNIAFTKKDYNTAAATFLTGYKKYSKSERGAEMISMAASSFGKMGEKEKACTAYGILYSDHPNMPAKVKRSADLEKTKYGCKP